jgi:16S rRNA (adenine1518-N6/adenine1519-N6)-dimethyltransferase
MKVRSAELLKKHHIKLKKTLGQNLLLDLNINRKMVDAAGVGPNDSVVEVGAGIGDLTEILAERAREVLTIEIDRAFEPALRERFEGNPKVTLFMGDILNHSVNELVDRFLPAAQSLKMVSNLPYYITSPTLMHFLESPAAFISLTVMVQREVAERIVAAPGGKNYGLLSLACQFYARPRIVHVVSRKCFLPPPRVESAIVHLACRDALPLSGQESDIFFDIIHAAFGQRRKKLVNALTSAKRPMFCDKHWVTQLLQDSEISPDCRAETVSLEGYVRLALAASEKLARQD